MDRRNFLLTLGAAGAAALYIPKRSYFFGGWAPAREPDLLTMLGNRFTVHTQYVFDEAAWGVLACRPPTLAESQAWQLLGGSSETNKQIYAAFLTHDDPRTIRGQVAAEYERAATYSLTHWDPAAGYADYLKTQELNAAERAWEMAAA